MADESGSPGVTAKAEAVTSVSSKRTRDDREKEVRAEAAMARAEAELNEAKEKMKKAEEEMKKAEARWEAKGMPEDGFFAEVYKATMDVHKVAMQCVNTVEQRVNTAQEVVKALINGLMQVRAAKRARQGPAIDPAVPDVLRKHNRFAPVLEWKPAGPDVERFTAQLMNLEFKDVEVPDGEPLKVARLDVWPLFGDSDSPASRNLVLRAEVRRGYEAVWKFRQKLDARPDSGSGLYEGRYRVVTGPPGSGKSRGMTYLLSLALACGERRPVVYEARNIGKAFVWLPNDKNGYDTYATDIQMGLPMDALVLLQDRKVVYLIDTEAEGSESNDNHWAYNVSCCGTVYVAASPKPGRLANFGMQKKSSSRRNFCFNPWTPDELVAARDSMGWDVNEEELRARIADVGPFPRYISSHEIFEGRRESIRKVVLKVPERCVSNLFTQSWDPDESDDKIAALVHSSAMMAKRVADDELLDDTDNFNQSKFAARKFRLAPASVMVATMLGAQFAEQFITSYSNQSAEASSLMGKLFEAAALLVLAAGTRLPIAKLTATRTYPNKNQVPRLYAAGHEHAWENSNVDLRASEIRFVDAGELLDAWAALPNTQATDSARRPAILVPRVPNYPAIDAVTNNGFSFQMTQSSTHSIQAETIDAAVKKVAVGSRGVRLVFVIPWFRKSKYTRALEYEDKKARRKVKQYVIVVDREHVKDAFERLSRTEKKGADEAALCNLLARYM